MFINRTSKFKYLNSALSLKRRRSGNRGFTLIELIVTIVIFVIITGVILSSYPKYGDRLSLGRISREMSLLIRQAQVYGIAVKKVGVGDAVTAPHFGVYFDSSKPKEFIFFSDRGGVDGSTPNNNHYDAGSGCATNTNTECEEAFVLRGREYIESITIGSSPPETCQTQSTCDMKLAIIFARPDPDAIFYREGQTDALIADYVSIRLASDRFPGEFRTIRIWATGQIAVISK